MVRFDSVRYPQSASMGAMPVVVTNPEREIGVAVLGSGVVGRMDPPAQGGLDKASERVS